MERIEITVINCLTRPLSGRSTFNDHGDSWAATLSFFFLIPIFNM